MKVSLCCVAIGGWYPRGLARLIDSLHRHNINVEMRAFVNTLPPGAPQSVIEDGWDYTAYCAKPFALMEAMTAGVDIAILIDAAFFAIRPIQPLIDHIAHHGYFFCKNGNWVGHWSSDRCLDRMGMSRDEAMTVEEVTSYCVGVNFADGRCVELVQRWCGRAQDRLTIPGRHENGPRGRNPGWCSDDQRCRGHRHDQTVLSIIAHRMGMRETVERPRFTAYAGTENETTVLVNQGGI